MVKTKQRENSSSSKSGFDLDLHCDESWVMVKKQKVTVLVPPLLIVQNSLTPERGPSELQPITRKVSNFQLESGNENSLHSKKVDQQSWKPVPAPSQLSLNLEKPELLRRQAPARPQPENPDRVSNSRSSKIFEVLITKKSITQARRLHGPGSFLSEDTLNRRLRALNLENKLQKVGGLTKWLMSLGLDQFVCIFQRKNISKFQLVNLTMKKLKDMGANAVGPRRKLMHAIDCVCHPDRNVFIRFK